MVMTIAYYRYNDDDDLGKEHLYLSKPRIIIIR